MATVAQAIKEGTLPSLKKNVIQCVDCGKRATDYDHRDYSKPLEVVPVCRSCNIKRGPGENRTCVSARMSRKAYRMLKKMARRDRRTIIGELEFVLSEYFKLPEIKSIIDESAWRSREGAFDDEPSQNR